MSKQNIGFIFLMICFPIIGMKRSIGNLNEKSLNEEKLSLFCDEQLEKVTVDQDTKQVTAESSEQKLPYREAEECFALRTQQEVNFKTQEFQKSEKIDSFIQQEDDKKKHDDQKGHSILHHFSIPGWLYTTWNCSNTIIQFAGVDSDGFCMNNNPYNYMFYLSLCRTNNSYYICIDTSQEKYFLNQVIKSGGQQIFSKIMYQSFKRICRLSEYDYLILRNNNTTAELHVSLPPSWQKSNYCSISYDLIDSYKKNGSNNEYVKQYNIQDIATDPCNSHRCMVLTDEGFCYTDNYIPRDKNQFKLIKRISNGYNSLGKIFLSDGYLAHLDDNGVKLYKIN